ncbi:MAG: GntR family transcriptional regulator [Muribaculaceae bacterium]|nr:GntR family transcriptional regulator [Muribaculaceae bacterium]MDD6019639.1 GntR family transcriptional regulator [bacterium]MDD6027049.1 GntR family transcriptional regulator [bacterium]
MNFKDNKPIYIQIAEHICDDVLAGIYRADERIPSVREFAASVEVNANTVVRSYDYLQQSGIIYNKRGLGYFVADGAAKIITDMRRKQILGDELSLMFSRMATIGISPDELQRLYTEYLNAQQ